MDSLFDNKEQSSFKSYLLLALIVLLLGGSLIYFLAGGDQIQQTQPQKKEDVTPQDKDSAMEVQGNKLSKEEAVISVVEEVGPAIVKITTEQEEVVSDFFAWQTKQKVRGQGSGVIINTEGYIITNNHVIDGVDQISVFLPEDKREYQGKVIGRDPATDLAVIKIDPQGKKLPTVEFGSAKELQVGQLTIAIGNPYGFSKTVTTGVISALGRKVPLLEHTELTDMIQTDAAINPGNSGGALLNSQGEVIGINTAIIEQAQGIGFAIPIDTVQEITKELIAHGKIIRPWIGIQGGNVTTQLAKEYNLQREEGIYIYRIIENSPAAEGNLEAGDIITKLNGQAITSMSQFRDILKKYEVSDKIRLIVYRNQDKKEITIELGKRP
ncbi:trypsin-like peptidase domain-containing protein [Halanaerocella petrolearia]